MQKLFFVAVLCWSVALYARAPGVHEVRFTEVMADSAMGIDWVELANLSNSEVDLKGCRLRAGLVRVKETRLPEIPMAPGRHLLIAGAAFPRECPVKADLVWKGLNLRSSMPEAVELWCPVGRQGRIVDRVLFNLHAAKHQKGASMVFCQGAKQQSGMMPGWVQTSAPAFCSILGADDLGTPGNTGGCPAPDTTPRIHPGDVEITEIMVQPVSGTPEWVELTNTTGSKITLDKCSLRIGTGEQGRGLVLDHIGIGPGEAVVLAGAPGVAKDGGRGREYVLKGLRLVDSKPQTLTLSCKDNVICQAGYDPGQGEVQQGHSICFDYATDPARPSAKCAASSLKPYFSAPNGVNYGTPFDPAPCDQNSLLESEETQARGCSVSFAPGSSAGVWALALFALLVVFFQRKRRNTSIRNP